LAIKPHARANTAVENVVNGVKTIMVNEALRTGRRVVASPNRPC
jgi:hypothetical protein